MKIGELISERIKKLNISQKKLSEVIGVSETSMSQIIKGRFNPSEKTLSDISGVIKIPVPVMWYLCIDESDVAKEKIEVFRMLQPAMVKFICDIFDVDITSLH